MPRVTGTVKMFIDRRPRPDGSDGGGYGFITNDWGGDDVFVHRSSLGPSCEQEKDGRRFRVLLSGQRVSFEIVPSGKGNGKKAAAVELI